jgi:DNA end-binding protein Ku
VAHPSPRGAVDDRSGRMPDGREVAMSRPIWTGAIAFGIVNIPVKLVTAVRDHSLHFNQVSVKDRKRIRYLKVAEGSTREVPAQEIAKAYELSKGHYVVVEDEEFARLAARRSKAIDILDFVALDEIDPLFFDQPYYVAPDERAGKAYDLFLKALEDSGKVAIAQFVMRSKEYLGALRPHQGALVLETMRYADEIVRPDEVVPKHKAEVRDRELKIAEQLIDAMTAKFDPVKYKDEYRSRVLDFVEHKAHGKGELVLEQAAEEEGAGKGKVLDLMSALEASLQRNQRERRRADDAPKSGHPRRRRHSRAS